MNNLNLIIYYKNLHFQIEEMHRIPTKFPPNQKMNQLQNRALLSKKSCISANIWDFILTLPEGLGTHIGDDSSLISIGQKQRICIARSIISNPKILLLDEATSALDTESELLVHDELEKLTKGRTTIMIAHRLSTIKNADRILVMSNGQIIESGI